MLRFALFIAIGSAWVAALVLVGAYAGWTFVALQGVGVTQLSDPALTTLEPALGVVMARYVGGQITRVPFEIVNWVSVFLPAILATLVGGIPAKCIGTEEGKRLRRWQLAAVIAIAVALLLAIMSLQSGIELRVRSGQYWITVGGNDAALIATAKATLDVAHGRAESIYLSLTGLSALSTVLGGVFIARRRSIVSRILI